MGSSSERPAEDRRELSREAGNGTQSVGPGAGRPTPAGFAPRRAQAAAPGPRRRNCGPSARGVEGIAQGPTSRIARGAQRGTSSPQEAASAGPFVSVRGSEAADCQAASVLLSRGSAHPSTSARSFLSAAAPCPWSRTSPSNLFPAASPTSPTKLQRTPSPAAQRPRRILRCCSC